MPSLPSPSHRHRLGGVTSFATELKGPSRTQPTPAGGASTLTLESIWHNCPCRICLLVVVGVILAHCSSTLLLDLELVLSRHSDLRATTNSLGEVRRGVPRVRWRNSEVPMARVYVYTAAELPPTEGGLLNALLQCPFVAESIGGKTYRKFGSQDAAILHQYGQLANSARRTNNPAEADVFYIPYFPALNTKYFDRCTGNATLLRQLQRPIKFRTAEVRAWLQQQPHYPDKPHTYSWMMASTAQLEDMANLVILRIDGEKECFGCAIECPPRRAFPRVMHIDRQQEYLGATPFIGVPEISGLTGTGIMAPYAALPILVSTSRAQLEGPRPIDFMFMGTQNRNFAGQWVRQNLTAMFKAHGTALNLTTATNGSYADNMWAAKYCLCPRGDSSSAGRLFDAIAAGCVPILVSDALVPPFGASVNWASFSVQFSECTVRDPARHAQTAAFLSTLLEPVMYNRLRAALIAHRDKFLYSRGNPLGGAYRANSMFVNALIAQVLRAAKNATAARLAPQATPVFDPFKHPLSATAVMMAPRQCPLLRFPRSSDALPVSFKNARSGGRLGNQIFQYAAVRGITTHYGTPISAALNPHEGSGACTAAPFGAVLGKLRSKDPAFAPDFRKRFEDGFGRWDNRTLGYTKQTKLVSYFQSWRYFCNVLPMILAELSHFFEMCHGGSQALTNMLREHHMVRVRTTTVAVHLRLGDVVRDKTLWNVTPEWLVHALQLLGSNVGSKQPVVLLVFCGDIRPGQQDLCDGLVDAIKSVDWGPDRRATTVSVPAAAEHTPEHDMAIISACDHAVITWGTFAWWPALVVNSRGGRVVAPSWLYSGELASEFKMSDFYPPTFDLVDSPTTVRQVDGPSPEETLREGLPYRYYQKRVTTTITADDVEICRGVRNESLLWFGRRDPRTELMRCVEKEPPGSWEYGQHACTHEGCKPR